MSKVTVFVLSIVSLVFLTGCVLAGLIVRVFAAPAQKAIYHTLFTSIWFRISAFSVVGVVAALAWVFSWFGNRIRWVHYILLVVYVGLNGVLGGLISLGTSEYYIGVGLGVFIVVVIGEVVLVVILRVWRNGLSIVKRFGDSVAWMVRGGLIIGLVFSLFSMLYGAGETYLVATMAGFFGLLAALLLLWDLLRLSVKDDIEIHTGREVLGVVLLMSSVLYSIIGIAFTVGTYDWGGSVNVLSVTTSDKYSELEEAAEESVDNQMNEF